MALETTPFLADEYLRTPEAIAAFLEDAIQDKDDPHALTEALGIVARSLGMSEIARQVGVSREGLYKALTAAGDPRLSTLVGVLQAIGLRLSVGAPVKSRKRYIVEKIGGVSSGKTKASEGK